MKPPFNFVFRSLLQPMAVILTCICGCSYTHEKSEVVEKVPTFETLKLTPALSGYLSEFANYKTLPVVAVRDRPEPAIPANRELVAGRIVSVDDSTNCSSCLIQSYTGKTWLEGQKLYLWNGVGGGLNEITNFSNEIVSHAFLLSRNDCTNQFILVESSSGGYALWATEILELNLVNGQLKRVCAGSIIRLSPDRTMAVFLRSSKDGFHSLHLLNFASGQITTILSAWAASPADGLSWDWRWSEDSKAINILGTTLGYQRSHRAWRSFEFNIIYLVGEDKTFLAPQ